MRPEDEPQPDEDDKLPRQGFFAGMPKRSLSRVLILLALLAGILYLRQRAGSIANCMSDAFHAPPPTQRSATPLKVRVETRPAASGSSTR
jgi:hypothetical protein